MTPSLSDIYIYNLEVIDILSVDTKAMNFFDKLQVTGYLVDVIILKFCNQEVESNMIHQSLLDSH